MANDELKRPNDKVRFDFCSKCGRKGLYHIRQQYYRCRYCGTYIISATDKPETEKPE